jgi:MOSC domain-containing protein YiiM
MNIEGDGQADLEHHGGPDKAVLAYAADHYAAWELEFARDGVKLEGFGPGGFGENLTVDGVTEHDVCIGDIWCAGDVSFQVSQPRQPCWKLGRRWRLPDLPQRVIRTGRSGWYHRVLHEGMVQVGMEVVLERRPNPAWTVARVASLRYGKHIDPIEATTLAHLEELSGTWRADFANRHRH